MKRRARRGQAVVAKPVAKPAPEPEKKLEERTAPDYCFNKRTELFECAYCDKALKTEQGILDHVASKHQE